MLLPYSLDALDGDFREIFDYHSFTWATLALPLLPFYSYPWSKRMCNTKTHSFTSSSSYLFAKRWKPLDEELFHICLVFFSFPHLLLYLQVSAAAAAQGGGEVDGETVKNIDTEREMQIINIGPPPDQTLRGVFSFPLSSFVAAHETLVGGGKQPAISSSDTPHRLLFGICVTVQWKWNMEQITTNLQWHLRLDWTGDPLEGLSLCILGGQSWSINNFPYYYYCTTVLHCTEDCNDCPDCKERNPLLRGWAT